MKIVFWFIIMVLILFIHSAIVGINSCNGAKIVNVELFKISCEN